ncbi:MAG: nucleotide exchange factor GrpE [Deltaproteobacteria bacterium]|nr:nucleotide exchange factor GrpE [Deltaproteobacteria bacterium]
MAKSEKTKVDQLREALKVNKQGEQPSQPEALPAEGSAPAAEGEPIDALQSQIRAAEEEAKAHYDKLLRVMAEFDNFKKRAERERVEQIQFANQRLIEELLPVLDHLDEALANTQAVADGGETARSLCEGVELTRRQFLGILARYDLEPIEPEAGEPFDPAVHEAVAQIDAEGVAAGGIVQRLRRGYKMRGRVLRAAMVTVARGGPSAGMPG